jgi:hypothetical protein
MGKKGLFKAQRCRPDAIGMGLKSCRCVFDIVQPLLLAGDA